MNCRQAFLDTNILLYSISNDPTEAAKRERAEALLERDDLRLSTQVLQEFYVQATRASRSTPLAHDIAAGLVRAWMRFEVQPVTTEIVLAAFVIKERFGFSYWDCAIIAAAQAQGCDVLFSEDLSHGQVVDGLRIIDPFR